MTKLLLAAAVGFGLLGSSTFAAEKTVTLAVQNMSFATCPYTVKASLEALRGVTKVLVSYEEKTAVVTYNDGTADVQALVKATTYAGYPCPSGEDRVV